MYACTRTYMRHAHTHERVSLANIREGRARFPAYTSESVLACLCVRILFFVWLSKRSQYPDVLDWAKDLPSVGEASRGTCFHRSSCEHAYCILPSAEHSQAHTPTTHAHALSLMHALITQYLSRNSKKIAWCYLADCAQSRRK